MSTSDPKPTHPVARAIWEAMLDDRIDDPELSEASGWARAVGGSLRYPDALQREADEWDRVAREAGPQIIVYGSVRLSDDRELSPEEAERICGIKIESAHRREGGEDATDC